MGGSAEIRGITGLAGGDAVDVEVELDTGKRARGASFSPCKHYAKSGRNRSTSRQSHRTRQTAMAQPGHRARRASARSIRCFAAPAAASSVAKIAQEIG
jgi:hypothetical protein